MLRSFIVPSVKGSRVAKFACTGPNQLVSSYPFASINVEGDVEGYKHMVKVRLILTDLPVSDPIQGGRVSK